MSKINIKVTLTTPLKTIDNTYKAIFHPELQQIVYLEDDKTKTTIELKNVKTLDISKYCRIFAPSNKNK